MRYFIEQAPDRFYQASELDAAKARARRLSARCEGGVYVIAEQFSSKLRDYEPVGSIAYYGGVQDAREGCFT